MKLVHISFSSKARELMEMAATLNPLRNNLEKKCEPHHLLRGRLHSSVARNLHRAAFYYKLQIKAKKTTQISQTINPPTIQFSAYTCL